MNPVWHKNGVADRCEAKKKGHFSVALFIFRSLTMTYSHMANATLPSALSGFTSEFEMGSGGSRSLLSSDKLSWLSPNSVVLLLTRRCRYSFFVLLACPFSFSLFFLFQTPWGYMVKPHEQLVLVSSTPHSAYTPSLSTS